MKRTQSICVWEHTALWRKGIQDEKKPAAYSWENPSLYYSVILWFCDSLTLACCKQGISCLNSDLTKSLRELLIKRDFFQEEFILQWQQDAIACLAKFVWKGSFAITQIMFSSYHRQKRLFQKQTGDFSPFCTTATVLTAMLKLFSQTLWISGQKETPEGKPEEIWVAAQ